MSDLSQDLTILQESWTATVPLLKANPDILEAAVPGCSVEQVGEAVETFINWAPRARSPKGFRPIYPIARLQLAASVKKLAQQAQNLKADPAAQFPTFVAQLLQSFAPITAVSTFSEKAESQRMISELGGELAQHLSLLNTAQAELSSKLSVLSKAESAANEVSACAEAAKSHSETIQGILDTLEENSTAAKSHLDAITAVEGEIAASSEQIKSLEKRNETLVVALEEQSKRVQDLIGKTETQQKLIDALLPRGTSAGLASAFNHQRRRFGWTQMAWAAAFLGSVTGLFFFTWNIKTELPTTGTPDLWSYLLLRLLLASPLIWLGWFSAIQYGNVLRLKEDYAFKEATSMAFAGYRDHMEHLEGVSESESATALEKLSLVTISILGNDPLRLLQGQASDASPLEKIAGILRGNKPTSKTDV